MKFQLSYLKSLKMMLLKCCTQYVIILEISAVATGLEKVSFHSNPKVGKCQTMLKLLYSSFHASKAMRIILQARLQQDMNHKIPDVLTGF